MNPLLRCLLPAAFLLTTGCRSGKVAFEFAPPPPAPTEIAGHPKPTAAPPALAAPATVPAAVAVASAPAPRPSAAPTPYFGYRHSALLHRREAAARAPSRRTPPPDDSTEHKTRHLVLGGLLVVGGVVGGILLGGWLGLGVGAAVVLAGYYFLGLAFGGKHGWREVFQEFFNL
ncbi:hypothetical protein SAMN02745146_0652 [Hymenobacter daecheongensis DSM 21074]|uniref:Translation initiation factor IF-2 n=2 Tax=Hymenobacter daecheongensis TaxID=496053 RepID=A0A1M6AIP4_9BACT|nr:hypothetical protein SAMN02745146_0652 [Hymenobacter daecheongensis DSM 21074]